MSFQKNREGLKKDQDVTAMTIGDVKRMCAKDDNNIIVFRSSKGELVFYAHGDAADDAYTILVNHGIIEPFASDEPEQPVKA